MLCGFRLLLAHLGHHGELNLGGLHGGDIKPRDNSPALANLAAIFGPRTFMAANSTMDTTEIRMAVFNCTIARLIFEKTL